jgi:hypothetical protein
MLSAQPIPNFRLHVKWKRVSNPPIFIKDAVPGKAPEATAKPSDDYPNFHISTCLGMKRMNLIVKSAR